CYIRVTDAVQGCKWDQSNATFTVTYNPPTPILLTPNGAASDTFNVLCVVPITWNTSTFFSTVDLFYSTNNVVSWNTITTGLTNNGTYNWTIPNNITPSTQCLIKAANTADNTVYDVSNNPFTIFPGITVLTPNGGE